jgi:ribosomal protein L37AE/L43A
MSDTPTTTNPVIPAVTPVTAPAASVPPKPVDDNPIVFYCKDCGEITDVRRVGGKYVYTCKKCGTKNVAFGTKKSIYGFFKIEDREKTKLREAKREEKRRAQFGDKSAKPRAS